MPQGVTFYKKDIDPFILKMTTVYGFKRMRDWQTILLIKKSLTSSMMKNQKGKKGIETCLSWTSPEHSFLSVYIWLSYVEAEEATRKNDFGWVLIFDTRTNEVAYFRFPRRRTKNFLKRIEDDAYICKELISKYWAPRCKICDTLPTIELVRGNVFHEVHFVCPAGHRTSNDDICQKIPLDTKKGKRLRRLLLADIHRYHRMTIKNDENRIFPVPARVKRFLSKNAKNDAQNTNAPNNPYNDGEHHFYPDE